MRLKSLIVVISLLLILESVYSQEFTEEELRKIDYKLRLLEIVTQENRILKEEVSLYKWQAKRYREMIEDMREESWLDRHKFEIGFICGILFTWGTGYFLVIK